MKRCVACAEEIQEEAQLCRFCRTRQDDAGYIPAASPLSSLSYPREEHRISETWAGAAEEIKTALIELGLDGVEVEPHTTEHGKLIAIDFLEATHHIGMGPGGRWVHIEFVSENPTLTDESLNDIGPVPPRGLAIIVVGWLLYYLQRKAIVSNYFEQLGQTLGKPVDMGFNPGANFQATMLQLSEALAQAQIPEFWVFEAEPSPGEDEATYLVAVALATQAWLPKMVEKNLTPEKIFEDYLKPHLSDLE